jgi:hypothetical protein
LFGIEILFAISGDFLFALDWVFLLPGDLLVIGLAILCPLLLSFLNGCMPFEGKDLFTLPEGTLGLILIPMLDLFEGLGLLIAGLGELIFGIDFEA